MYDDKIALLLNNGVIMQTRIKTENKDLMKAAFEQVGLQFHNGPIVSMDVCIREPLVRRQERTNASKYGITNREQLKQLKNKQKQRSAFRFILLVFI